MRIAVDARELEKQPTGVGRVVQGLVEAWPAGDELVLLTRGGVLSDLDTAAAIEIVGTERGARLPDTLWEQWVLADLVAASGARALLAPGYGMPLRCRLPAAVCMHDCAPFARPDEFSWRERTRRRFIARASARRAAFLFVPSRFAATEAERYLDLPSARILVTPWGLGRAFGPVADERRAQARERYGVDEHCVLFVGSGFARRSLSTLVRRVARLQETLPRARLAIAGRAHERLGEAGDPAPLHLGYVPEADLPALYAAAGAVAYPSDYEGFGLPVLEALACGTPVVASSTAALAEVYSGRAMLVPHEDDDAWIDAMADALRAVPGSHRDATLWARARSWEPAARRVRERLADTAGTGS